MRLWLLAPLLILVATATGQNVRESNHTHGSLRRAGERAAKKMGIADWPRVRDQEVGTQVHITFDYRNSDIILLAYPMPGREKMMAVGRRLSVALAKPKADYILVDDRTYSSIDVEFNKYLVEQGKRHSISYDLSVMANTLAASPELPKPILIRIEGDDADVVTVESGGRKTEVRDSAFYHLAELGPGSTVTFSATLTWVAYVSAACFGGMFLLALWIFATMPWHMEKARLRNAGAARLRRDPAEVQRQYDRRKPWVPLLGVLPLMLIFGGMPLIGRHGLHQAVRLIPFSSSADSPWALLSPFLLIGGVVGGAQLVYRLDKRRRMLKDPALGDALASSKPIGEYTPPIVKIMPLLMLPVVLMLLAMPFLAKMRALPPVGRMIVIAGVIAGPWIAFGLLAFRLNRRWKPAREPGDWVYEAAHKFGNLAGVKVRRVETMPAQVANAYVNLFGTVGVTSTLLESFEPDEVRAVVAHEIGHMKARHLQKRLPISLGMSLALWTGLYFGLTYLEGKVSEPVMQVLSSPLIFFLSFPLTSALLLGPLLRRNEHEADLFAAQATGDTELVIRALTKLHIVNESPFRLKQIDEALSSHPSLENRIRTLRNLAPPSDVNSQREAQ